MVLRERTADGLIGWRTVNQIPHPHGTTHNSNILQVKSITKKQQISISWEENGPDNSIMEKLWNYDKTYYEGTIVETACFLDNFTYG